MESETKNKGKKDLKKLSKKSSSGDSVRKGTTLEKLKEDIDNLKSDIKKVTSKKNDTTLKEHLSSDAPNLPPFNFIVPRRTLKGHSAKVYALHWSLEDPHRLLSVSQDCKLIEWNTFTTYKNHAIDLKNSWVMSCANSPGGKFAACGSLDTTCVIYSLENTSNTDRFVRCLEGHVAFVSGCRFVGTEKIVTCSGDTTARLWDLEKSSTISKFEGHTADVLCLSLQPNNHHFITGGLNGTVILWDLRESKYRFKYEAHPKSDVNSIKFLVGDEQYNTFATASGDGTCKLFDIRAGKELIVYGNQDSSNAANAVDFSKTGRFLFVGYVNGNCGVWETLTGKSITSLKDHSKSISSLGVNIDGTALCTGGWDNILKIYA